MSRQYHYNGNNDSDSEPGILSAEYRHMEPEYRKYQLIGDSQFLRFSEQILNQKRKKSGGLAYLGLCVSGQKISDLLERVKSKFYPTSEKAILMIGTNDLLQSTPVCDMRKDIQRLVCKLIERGVRTLILLTIPPVPRLATSADHWNRLRDYNYRIKKMHTGKDIFVVDAYSEFVIKRSPRPILIPLRRNRSPIRYRHSRSPTRSRNNGSPIRSRHSWNSNRDSRNSLNDSVERRLKKEPRSSPNESFDRSSTCDWDDSSLTGSSGSHFYFKKEEKCSRDQQKGLLANTARTTSLVASLPKMGEFRVEVTTLEDPDGSIKVSRKGYDTSEEDRTYEENLRIKLEARRPSLTSPTVRGLKRKEPGSAHGGDSPPPFKRRSPSLTSPTVRGLKRKEPGSAHGGDSPPSFKRRSTSSTSPTVRGQKRKGPGSAYGGYSPPPSKRRSPSPTSPTFKGLKRKEPGSAYGGDSPPLSERRSLNQSNVEDDHDDRFCEDDSFSQTKDVTDQVNLEYFEEWFSQKAGRKDLIHLNYTGLRVIKRLIDLEIPNTRGK